MKNLITILLTLVASSGYSQSIDKYYVAQKADNTFFIEILKEYDATFNKPDILETVVDKRQFIVVPGVVQRGYQDKYYREVLLYGNTKGYANAEEIEIMGNNFEYSERWQKNIADEPEDYMLEKLVANKPLIKEQLAKKFIHTLRLVKTPKGKYYIIIEIKGSHGAFVQAKRSGASVLLPNTLSYGSPFVIFKDWRDYFLDATENPVEYEDYLAKGLMKFSNFVTGGVLDWDKLMDYAQKLGVGKTEEFDGGSINLSNYTQKEVYWGSYSDTRYNLGPKAKSIQIFIPVNGTEAKIGKEISPESIIYMAALTLYPEKDRNYSYRTLVYHDSNNEFDDNEGQNNEDIPGSKAMSIIKEYMDKNYKQEYTIDKETIKIEKVMLGGTEQGILIWFRGNYPAETFICMDKAILLFASEKGGLKNFATTYDYPYNIQKLGSGCDDLNYELIYNGDDNINEIKVISIALPQGFVEKEQTDFRIKRFDKDGISYYYAIKKEDSKSNSDSNNSLDIKPDWIGVNREQINYLETKTENDVIELKGYFSQFWMGGGVEPPAARFKTSKEDLVVAIGLSESDIQYKDERKIWLGDAIPFEQYFKNLAKQNNSYASDVERRDVSILVLKKRMGDYSFYSLLGIKPDVKESERSLSNFKGTYYPSKELPHHTTRPLFIQFEIKNGALYMDIDDRRTKPEKLYYSGINDCYYFNGWGGIEAQFFWFGLTEDNRRYVDIGNSSSKKCDYERFYLK